MRLPPATLLWHKSVCLPWTPGCEPDDVITVPRGTKGVEYARPTRLVITMYAKPGKGAALAQAMADRCRAVQEKPGCQQFEVFQSALDPDTLVVLEFWDDQAALDAHAQVNAARPPNPGLAALRADGTRPRDDYV